MRISVRLAVAMLSAICVFRAIGHAASLEPDKVSLSESTMRWSTVKYATTAEHGFVDGSLQTTTVDRTFKTNVLENRFLKVTLLPELAGAYCRSFTNRPATNSFIAPRSADPTGSRPAISTTTG